MALVDAIELDSGAVDVVLGQIRERLIEIHHRLVVGGRDIAALARCQDVSDRADPLAQHALHVLFLEAGLRRREISRRVIMGLSREVCRTDV